jgi:AraC-like DNA-binding protein
MMAPARKEVTLSVHGARSPKGGTSSAPQGSSAADVGEQVRQVVAALLASGTGYPDIQQVADRVGTSVRTLQRRLRVLGATYADVVQQARCAAAREMLQEQQRRIGEVARRLGYSDTAHFSRAFHRWTGVTPREFRRGS